jgi:hypothetical protein
MSEKLRLKADGTTWRAVSVVNPEGSGIITGVGHGISTTNSSPSQAKEGMVITTGDLSWSCNSSGIVPKVGDSRADEGGNRVYQVIGEDKGNSHNQQEEYEISSLVMDGYELDLEKSTKDRVVFKKKESLPKTFNEIGSISGFYLHTSLGVQEMIDTESVEKNKDLFSTMELAEAALAIAQLSQLRDIYRQGWTPTKDDNGVVIFRDIAGDYHTSSSVWSTKFLSFPDKDSIAEKFLFNFLDLIRKASPILEPRT